MAIDPNNLQINDVLQALQSSGSNPGYTPVAHGQIPQNPNADAKINPAVMQLMVKALMNQQGGPAAPKMGPAMAPPPSMPIDPASGSMVKIA